MGKQLVAWVSLVGTLGAAGCGLVLGVDGGPYTNVGEGAGGTGGGTPASGPLGALGQPCQNVQELACGGHAQKVKLICGADKKWQSNGTCGPNEFCDASATVNQGTCLPAALGCADKMPGDALCDGLKRTLCGPDLVTVESEVDCQAPSNACLVATCVAGMCGTASKANGTACDDGNACTQSDTCQAGTCIGASAVTCTALDQCHVAGTCNPATGTCNNPSKANGIPCVPTPTPAQMWSAPREFSCPSSPGRPCPPVRFP